MIKVYIIGSLRNPAIPQVAEMLRSLGHEVFDDWYAAGPEADDYWQKYERAKGSSFAEALAGFAAQHVFAFDKKHLDACDIAVMVMPAGKSAHLELGYCRGLGKKTVILMDKEPERFDVMYNFADKVCTNDEELIQYLSDDKPQFEDTSFGSLNPWPFPLPTPREQFYAEADADTVTAPVAPSFVLVPAKPTPEMVAAYLAANSTYWKEMDEGPEPIGKWRNGTPAEATVESYVAMLAAAPGVDSTKSCATCKGCDGAYAPASFGRDCTGYQRERG